MSSTSSTPAARPTGTAARRPAGSPVLEDPCRDGAPLVARLREEDPVHWVPGLDAWFVTRHADVRQLFGDARLTPDPRAYERYVPPTEPDAARWLAAPPFLSARPGEPGRGRRLVSAAFTPRAVARMEHVVRDVVEEVAAPLRGRTGAVDLTGELAARIPGTVIGRVLGVPPKGENERRFFVLSKRMVRNVNPVLSDAKRRKTERATVELCEYLLELVLERREAPTDDLISDLVRASLDEADVSPDEIVRLLSGLVTTGTETIQTACTRALRTLFRHPDALAELRRDRTLLPSAVGELLRFDSGLFGMPRYVLQDLELRGRPLRKGQLVILSLMGADRDPRAFPEPDRLDLRRDTKGMMGFGHGAHHCIGANLARTELRLMLGALLDLLPERARLLEDRIRWTRFGLMSCAKSLPVDFGPATPGS